MLKNDINVLLNLYKIRVKTWNCFFVGFFKTLTPVNMNTYSTGV